MGADRRGGRPRLWLGDYAGMDSGVPAPPYVLSVFGPDWLANWDSSDLDAYREKRGRGQQAMLRYLDKFYPGIAPGVVASSFNTPLSRRHNLPPPPPPVFLFAPPP